MTIARDVRCDICEVTRSLMTMKRDKGGGGGIQQNVGRW